MAEANTDSAQLIEPSILPATPAAFHRSLNSGQRRARLLRTRAVVEWNAVTEWTGYPPRDAREIATALGRLQRRRIDAGDDHRTPWEVNAPPQAIVDFEMYQMHRSVDNLRAMGWM